MNGKKIGMLALMLLVAAAFVPAAFAATDFTMNWSGVGGVSGTFNAGNDAIISIGANGATHGQFFANDLDDNPYGYNVDSTQSWVKGYIDDGGDIYVNFNRTDSKTSMYGPADQWTDSYVGSSDTGQLIFRTNSNYASLYSSNYGFQSDQQFTASGSSYLIYHNIINGVNYGSLWASGSGTMSIDHMTDGYTTGTNIEFGKGCGCYTNADVSASGSGLFQLAGYGQGGLSGNGWSMVGPATYSASWTFGTGLTVTNYAFGGN